MIIACVYKTGGDFDSEYVESLYNKLNKYPFICLTDADDVPDHIPQKALHYGWDGWWSKMELFDPDMIKDDILYFDLDTVIVDDIDEMWSYCYGYTNMIMLDDFYFPKHLASGVMYIPENKKDIFWRNFLRLDSEINIMNALKGDQNFLELVIYDNFMVVDRWSQTLPDYIASYKVHISKTYPSHLTPLQVDVSKSKVICYHGKPRPKETNWAGYKL